MANVPFPPLFCSTPPPIEDTGDVSPINDDDDDDFGDFADAYQENLNNYMEGSVDSNLKGVPTSADFVGYVSNDAPIIEAERDFIPEPNIPQTKLNCDSETPPDIDEKVHCALKGEIESEDLDLKFTDNHTASLSSLSEPPTSSAASISPISKSPPPVIEARRPDDDEDDGDDDEDNHFGEFQFDKNIGVAKSDSGRSTENDSLSHEGYDKPKNVRTPSNIVFLEDLDDDSSDDERHSPRNRNNINCDENSSDFFSIYPIESVEQKNDATKDSDQYKVDGGETSLRIEAGKLEDQQPAVETNSDSIEESCSLSERMAEISIQSSRIETTTREPCADIKDIEIVESPHPITSDSKCNEIESSLANEEDEDDFANFQDFSNAPFTTFQTTWPVNSEISKHEVEKPLKESPNTSEESTTIAAEETATGNVNENGDGEDDDDDDFGEFTEAPVVATTSAPQTAVQYQAVPVPKRQNLAEQVKSILEMMFPIESAAANDKHAVPQLLKPIDFGPIESAKALDLEWSSSSARNVFIKSLGIDTRNIFLPEKWNPSMPRFAANLSGDPLEPLKPTPAPLQPENTASNTANKLTKSDIPVAEFDWNSSGLVNPLDGPKAEMVRESADAFKAESSNANANDIEIENKSSSNYDTDSVDTTPETSVAAAAPAGANLSSTLAGGSNIDSSDNNINNNIDIGLYDDDLSGVKSSTRDLPEKENVSAVAQSLELDENTKQNLDSKVSNDTEVVGCAIMESSPTIPLGMVYAMDGDAEIHIDNGVVSRSTFAGPLKETHIFTPSKNMTELYEKSLPTTTISPTVAPKVVVPIDFDYEKAAAGIIIDETVVHKEYRDVEYNPGFALDGNQMVRTESPAPKQLSTIPSSASSSSSSWSGAAPHRTAGEEECDDEFTEFQCVAPPEPPRNEKISTPTPINGMILSPAILLPQAISIESKQPKIEWGESAANIDPEELARIEQLFPQETSSRNSSKKSTPTHTNSLSISASIASKTSQDKTVVVDDDDWSDFVSVPVTGAPTKNSSRSPQKSKAENNDDDWSDFVSSVPAAAAAAAPQPNYTNLRVAPSGANGAYGRLPQFNSASWQNANFYNNPLSIYHKNHHGNAAVPASVTPTKLQNNNYNNYNNNNNNINKKKQQNSYSNSYSNNNQTPPQYLPNIPAKQKLAQQQQHQQQQQQQKIQIMQDFSTAPSDFNPYRPHHIPQSNNYTGPTNSHFQVGSAKVAPTVSLIPDLGFVAPAMPVHTAIINSLPKPNTNFKK